MKTDRDRQIDELEVQIQELKTKVAALRRERPSEEVADYKFKNWQGHEVTLSELFGERDQMILVHNMGRSCSYCTMWADGFIGLLPHLENRAAFVMTSPDEPEVQQAFAESRGWSFPMVSAAGTSFVADMGFTDEDGFMPGVSVFEKAQDGKIQRVARAEFGPGDDFCAVWHFFDLLPAGIDGWEPQLAYSAPERVACCHAAT